MTTVRALPLGWILITVTVAGSLDPLQSEASAEAARPTLILVLGAAGEPEFGTNFLHQAVVWKETAKRASAECRIIGEQPVNESNDREALRQLLQSQPRVGSQPLWLVLIGHGTFDGKVARFNLRGPDLSSAELADWLRPFERPVVLINTASASAPFLSALSNTNRLIVTATRSGAEQNFTRFGGYLAEAFAKADSDLNHDNQVSLLEAVLVASSKVEEFYRTEGRLATEHALLDDNGDAKGTPADWFQGVRAVRSPKGGADVDGARAAQIHLLLSPAEQALPPEIRTKRDALELSIARLRNRKSDLRETDYYRQLENLLLEVAQLYRAPEGVSPDN